jgi:hypothetical protein
MPEGAHLMRQRRQQKSIKAVHRYTPPSESSNRRATSQSRRFCLIRTDNRLRAMQHVSHGFVGVAARAMVQKYRGRGIVKMAVYFRKFLFSTSCRSSARAQISRKGKCENGRFDDYYIELQAVCSISGNSCVSD